MNNKAMQRSEVKILPNQKAIIKAACYVQINNFVTETQGVQTALIVTSDGFEIESVTRNDISLEKMAAMSSSFFALSEAILSEVKYTSTRSLVIESESGLVVMLAIGNASKDLYLCLIADTSSTLGQILWSARRCCERICANLEKYIP